MTPRPAVALYFSRLGHAGGGAERRITELAGALALRGFNVHLASWDKETSEDFYPLAPAVTRHKLGTTGGWSGKLLRVHRLAGLLRRNKIDVLIGFVMSGDKTVFAAARLAGVRLIAAERNAPEMYRLRYNAVQRTTSFACLHLCDRITVQFKDYIHGYPASLRDRIAVIANPVHPAQLTAKPAEPNPAGRYTLLAAGRLDPLQKRFDHLLLAFTALADLHPDWDLRLIGDGPHEHQLRQMTAELGLTRRVRFQPTTSDVFSAYAEAHLFAIPSLWEGFPNVLAEAMSHGLPAVGYRQVQGVAQLIEDGVSGWLADGRSDPGAFAASLSAAMSEAGERKRRGRQAQLAMAAYAPATQYDFWVQLILSCMERKIRQ